VSNFESTGLRIRASDPLLKTNRSPLLYELNAVNEYNHEIRLLGGFYSANIAFVDNEENINDWIQSGVGRHIEVHNPALDLAWAGFVDVVEVTFGENTYSVGPLVDTGNRVAVIYSTVDTSETEPVVGERAITAFADNSASQNIYGVWEKIRSLSGATSTVAEQVRDTYVNDPAWAYPYVSNKLNTQSSDLIVNLKCLGYWHYLNAFYYTNSAAGDVDLSDKLQDVIASHSIFSTDYSKITANTIQVPDAVDQEQFGETLIKRYVSIGDASNNPYHAGFYGNQRLVYATVPTTIEYQKRRGQQVTDRLGGIVSPWDVRPAKWLFQPDMLVGRHPPVTSASLGSDPRAMLVDVVKYTAPYELNIAGTKYSQLDQLLVKNGLGI